MTRIFRYYTTYRRVGFGRMDAFRFAWLVAASGARLIPSRVPTRR